MIIYSTYSIGKYVGIGGSALRLIRSYFCDRTKEFKLMVLCLILLVCCVGLSSGTNEILFVFASTWCDP